MLKSIADKIMIKDKIMNMNKDKIMSLTKIVITTGRNNLMIMNTSIAKEINILTMIIDLIKKILANIDPIKAKLIAIIITIRIVKETQIIGIKITIININSITTQTTTIIIIMKINNSRITKVTSPRIRILKSKAITIIIRKRTSQRNKVILNK